MTSPYRVELTDADRRVLTARSRSERAPHRDVLRARIVLAAATDMDLDATADAERVDRAFADFLTSLRATVDSVL